MFHRKELDPLLWFQACPHIAERIFSDVTPSCLARCREVSSSWKKFIDRVYFAHQDVLSGRFPGEAMLHGQLELDMEPGENRCMNKTTQTNVLLTHQVMGSFPVSLKSDTIEVATVTPLESFRGK